MRHNDDLIIKNFIFLREQILVSITPTNNVNVVVPVDVMFAIACHCDYGTNNDN
jgi:hypothetical protein